ncbi:MAG: hypothetical protein ACR2PS_09765 [Pseudomonadales bacterium]
MDEVPQDNAKSFAGQKKGLYAVDDEGTYTIVPSSGWEAEEIVLELAIEQFQTLTDTALQRVRAGESSALEFHMYSKRMDVTLLAQSTGFFRWQVRRHCKPAIFARLSEARLQRYADVLDVSITELRQVPDSQDKQ